jgi:hypothetical protein
MAAEALDYRKQGYSSAEIAEAMNLKQIDVENLIEETLEATRFESPRQYILLQIHRLYDAQKALAQNIAQGELESIRENRQIEKEITLLKMQLDPQMRDVFSHASLMTLVNLDPSGKRLRGRPPHVVTAASIAKVQAFAMIGRTKEIAAKLMGFDIKTLDKYYSTIWDTAKDAMLAQMGGVVVEQVMKGDGRLGLEILSRHKVEGFVQPQSATSFSAKMGDEPAAPGSSTPGKRIMEVTIVGGLPEGSTPENPGGIHHSDVPPEEA